MSEINKPNRRKEDLTRRHFIMKSALAGGALAVPGLFSSFVLKNSYSSIPGGLIDKDRKSVV